MKQSFTLTIVALAVAGCASTKVEDTTPLNSTSVLKAEYAINGLYVPDYTGKQTVLTRESNRVIREKNEFDSWLMRWANSDESRVFDAQKNKSYYIDYDDETYSECPIKGCNEVSFTDSMFEEDDNAEEYQTYEEVGCSVDLKENSFNVDKTGKSRVINGFATEQYVVNWTTRYHDTTGAEDKNIVTFDFWTTAQNAQTKRALQVHEKFHDNYLKTIGDDNALMNLLGAQAYKAIAGFTGDISNEDSQFGGEIGKKLAIIKGYPISIKLEWKQQLKACKTARKPIDYSGGLDEVGSQLLGGLMDKGKEMVMDHWRKDPVVRYVYEIKSVEIKDIRDSQFLVPKEFKLINRS
ncbi:hypothetical protein [Pseudoalteromonas distincta]|uniref:hypothetical protein n=1 Tax=Pseudoalteromonas distincta TaxID=77608 RepID=UPI0039ECC72B